MISLDNCVQVATALEATELCYLSHGVLRLYEDPNKEEVPMCLLQMCVHFSMRIILSMFSPGRSISLLCQCHVFSWGSPIPFHIHWEGPQVASVEACAHQRENPFARLQGCSSRNPWIVRPDVRPDVLFIISLCGLLLFVLTLQDVRASAEVQLKRPRRAGRRAGWLSQILVAVLAGSENTLGELVWVCCQSASHICIFSQQAAEVTYMLYYSTLKSSSHTLSRNQPPDTHTFPDFWNFKSRLLDASYCWVEKWVINALPNRPKGNRKLKAKSGTCVGLSITTLT